jgi:predicted house-cleaning noncanonical NTP pyrophosphatase (MazG superfamily)
MKMRVFTQNKLWRDKAVELMEKTGSKMQWHRLDDAEYDKQLRLKLLEEAEEVISAASLEDLTNELADVVEVIQTLCTLNKISWDDVIAIQTKKRLERGGFDERMFVTQAAHVEGSFGDKYCLNDPEKYPEIIDDGLGSVDF